MQEKRKPKGFPVGSGRWAAQLTRRGPLVTLTQRNNVITLPSSAYFQIAHGLGEIVSK